MSEVKALEIRNRKDFIMDLVYTVALDADGNMGYTDDLNKFLYWSGCYGVPDDVTVG